MGFGADIWDTGVRLNAKGLAYETRNAKRREEATASRAGAGFVQASACELELSGFMACEVKRLGPKQLVS